MSEAASTLPLLALSNISKSFPGVRALSEVSFDLQAGEIHALVGENGAGKSTLLSCMNGLQRPDSGEIRLSGKVVSLPDAAAALANRLAMVHQELVLCPNLTVAQNIFLGREPRGRTGRLDHAVMCAGAAVLLDDIGARIDPARELGSLSLNEQQIVEICRALATDPKVIVLDEPTASLNDDQVVHLLEIVRRLRARGLGIVYVSHRLQEVLSIADRVTVLRDGQLVVTRPAQGLAEGELVAHMVGADRARKASGWTAREIGQVVLSVDELGVAGKFSNISFDLRKGEILGIAGLLGCHRETLAQSLFGAAPAHTGRIMVEGRTVQLATPHDAIANGIAFMPADRKNEGLVLSMSVGDNAALTTLKGLATWGMLRRGRLRAQVDRLIRMLSIKVAGLSQRVSQLSGGNQQKIVIAKWIARDSHIVIAEDPTRGVDIAAKAEIWDALRALASDGRGLIVMTTELEEMLDVCDRILVMSRGRLSGDFSRDDFSARAITERFFV